MSSKKWRVGDYWKWWLARNSAGQLGLVPTNYIEIIDHNPTKSAFGTSVPTAQSTTIFSNGTASTSSAGLTGPYASQLWYYGRLSREQVSPKIFAYIIGSFKVLGYMFGDAELKARGTEGDFLIRDSESNPGDYSISLKDNVRNKHFWCRLTRLITLSKLEIAHSNPWKPSSNTTKLRLYLVMSRPKKTYT
uniref:SH2 domain-containing protein n=1 Tax=Ditylenchus dipsaci TaxID=166011 RepID=A0A915EPQ4_9BILA